jgi:exopolyphosphatase/guanosine-5'-triphosphate,3'-diphosphate pyrophosphatase
VGASQTDRGVGRGDVRDDDQATEPPKDQPASIVAAIDIGSNAIRMAIAQILPDGELEVLEHLQRAVRLGQDTFRRGRLGGQTVRAAVAILRDYQRVLQTYGARHVRAVATTAVREAANVDTFLDRVLMATGLDVAVIDTSEESRLTVTAVRHDLGRAFGLARRNALICEVGGGSTVLTVLRKGEIAASQNLNLGSIRLQEMLSTTEESPDRSADLLRDQIANTVVSLQGELHLKRIRTFVAVGGDARFAARQVGTSTGSGDLAAISRSDFDKLVAKCQRHTTEELARMYGLSFADAETLDPALVVYQSLLHATGAEQIIVSHVSMRDGLLLDLVRSVTGQEDESVSKGAIQSAMAIAEKYRVDLKHARHVADLSVRLFDEMQGEHGLGARHRLLLRAAGLLHEVGGFVSSRAHHKHSYYLIANSEVFGLTRDELLVVAHVARYHRRACPKPTHVDYMAMPRDTRMVVSKLAALLRVADALDRGHGQQVRDLTCERRDENLILTVAGVADLTLERRQIAAKGDLFEDIYGLKVHVEEARPGRARSVR